MNPILKAYCSVNNFGNEIGMQLEVISPGEVRYVMPIKNLHLSNPMAAHGGAVAALMDGTLGVAALSLAVESNLLVSTIELKINFFRPVHLGDVLTGNGKVIYNGTSLVHSSGEIRNQDGVLICTGSGTFNKYPVTKNISLNIT